MVETQISSRGIEDKRVIQAMSEVPRDKFVASRDTEQAYNDYPLAIGGGQTISQPYMVAVMSELLQLSGNERVLEAGTGSGYQTAILAELAKEIFTIERLASLADRAKITLSALEYTNIRFKTGDATYGWKEHAPFERIIVTAGARDVPEILLEQLSDNGRMVIPIGGQLSQTLTLIEKKGKEIIRKACGGCVFVPLVGDYGCR